MEDEVIFRASSVKGGYGGLQIIWDISIEVSKHESVIVLGPNGAGKTTFFKNIMGIIQPWGGEIYFKGEDITKIPPFKRARKGLIYLSETGVFSELTVLENLRLSALNSNKVKFSSDLEKVYEVFPDLKKMKGDKASSLSGGQRKMLVVARALVSSPELLVVDEPSSGLSPMFVDKVIESLKVVREMGISMLVSEQNVRFLDLADRIYGLEHGAISFTGTKDELLKDETLRRSYFGSE